MNRRTFLQRLGILGAAVPFLGLKKKQVVEPRILIDPKCKNLIDEINSFQYIPVYGKGRYVRAKITTKGNGSTLVELEYSNYPNRGFKKEKKQ